MRIFAMLWIICFHFTDHSDLIFNSMTVDKFSNISLGWVTYAISAMGGGFGNCIFVLISGFLLCLKKFNFKRIVNLYLVVWFYSVTTYYVAVKLGYVDPGRTDQFLPILNNKYWFMSTYFCLMLFVPFLNVLINGLSKKYHLLLILLLFFISSFIPTFLYRTYYQVNSAIDIFILLYLIGSFIRIYCIGRLEAPLSDRFKVTPQHVALIIFCLAFVLLLYFEFKFARTHRHEPTYYLFFIQKSPIIIFATAFFVAFLPVKLKLSKIIDSLSKASFPAYLIHIGVLFPLFFKDLFPPVKYFSSWLFPLWMLFACVSIYLICYLFDLVKQIVFIPVNFAINVADSKINKFLK